MVVRLLILHGSKMTVSVILGMNGCEVADFAW